MGKFMKYQTLLVVEPHWATLPKKMRCCGKPPVAPPVMEWDLGHWGAASRRHVTPRYWALCWIQRVKILEESWFQRGLFVYKSTRCPMFHTMRNGYIHVFIYISLYIYYIIYIYIILYYIIYTVSYDKYIYIYEYVYIYMYMHIYI